MHDENFSTKISMWLCIWKFQIYHLHIWLVVLKVSTCSFLDDKVPNNQTSFYGHFFVILQKRNIHISTNISLSKIWHGQNRLTCPNYLVTNASADIEEGFLTKFMLWAVIGFYICGGVDHRWFQKHWWAVIGCCICRGVDHSFKSIDQRLCCRNAPSVDYTILLI